MDYRHSRKQLATVLQGLLPAYKMIDSPREIPQVDATVRGILQVVRDTINPGATIGAYVETYQLFVLDPSSPPNEDTLDELLDETIEVLEPIKWLSWGPATRVTHASSSLQGYLVTIQINSSTE